MAFIKRAETRLRRIVQESLYSKNLSKLSISELEVKCFGLKSLALRVFKLKVTSFTCLVAQEFGVLLFGSSCFLFC